MPSLQFKGKQFVANYHLGVPYCELIPQKSKSLTAKTSLHDNLILHGDNLKALKALLPTYAGKVKCIYIDPPYNTGNEGWAYNDAVNSPMHKEWLGETVDREDLTRHDKWLCMMMPRLKLLRDLLREDGAIFVSIDDNEVAHLRMLMDEVFGEENFVANVIWEKSDSPRMDAKFSVRHDHILIYTNNKNIFAPNNYIDEEIPEHYNKKDANGRVYYLKPLRVMGGNISESLFYPLIAPDGTKVLPFESSGAKGCWRWSKKKIEAEIERIEWISGKNGWNPYF
ncbi:MAG: site-specific DNA-methyltransferase, partial [Candidatus Gracilibacteria bacterium]|nr:site-specific DNA-methyltransferase [Candidatus Gracilibacteria bacterium]